MNRIRFMAMGLTSLMMLSAIIYAQTTKQASSTTTTQATSSPGKFMKVGILQPPGFLTLADKAKKHRNLYIKAVALLDGEGVKEIPSDARRIEFEIWLKYPRMRIKFKSPDHQQRVSDGRYSYLFYFDNKGKLICQRKLITKQNLYHTLVEAAIFVDAAGEYENLTSAVKFKPTAGVDISTYAQKMKFKMNTNKLKWFRIVPVKKPIHPIARNWDSVVGINNDDGLVRVLRGKKKAKDKEIIITYLFKVVSEGKVKDKDLKLPSSAAGTFWIDVDTSKPIPAPLKVINTKR